MKAPKYSILKIYASSTDKIDSRIMYQHIVELAKEKGISGATVYRGIMGYGQSSKISSSKFWELTEKLPITIELIDTTDKIESFYILVEEALLKMPKGCLVLIEPVSILLHKPGKEGSRK